MFSKNIQIPNFMEIRPVGPEMFHADGWTDRRTDMTKLIAAFAILRTNLKTEDNCIIGHFIFPYYGTNPTIYEFDGLIPLMT
jgi:hypothetical protein